MISGTRWAWFTKELWKKIIVDFKRNCRNHTLLYINGTTVESKHNGPGGAHHGQPDLDPEHLTPWPRETSNTCTTCKKKKTELLCVPLLYVFCVSHSTLLPLCLSTPECNSCSGGVGEVIGGQRVQGQVSMEIPHEQQLTCASRFVYSPCMVRCWGFVILVYCVSLHWRLPVVQLFVSLF